MKYLFLLSLAFSVIGCTTHATIEMPPVTQVYNKSFENKTFSYEILYSQPKPGVITGGEQMPSVPLEQAELSVASAATLKKLPDYIFEQLPTNVKRAGEGQSDFKLVVDLIAHDKKGPAYSRYEAGKSFGKNLLTLGLGPAEYNIVADFDAEYRLYEGGQEVFVKSYEVEESVDHQRGGFEGFNSLNDYAGQLLERHLILTLNDFFKESSKEYKER